MKKSTKKTVSHDKRRKKNTDTVTFRVNGRDIDYPADGIRSILGALCLDELERKGLAKTNF